MLTDIIQKKWTIYYLKIRKCYQAPSKNCEMRLLASSCVSFRLYVRPSVRLSEWKKSAPTLRNFMKFIWVFFQKSFVKFKFLLKSDKNNEHSTWRPIHIYNHISLNGLFCWFSSGCWKSVETVLPKVTRIRLSSSYGLDWVWTSINRSHIHPHFGGRMFPTRPAPQNRLNITIFETTWKLGNLQIIKILKKKFGPNYELRLMEAPLYTIHVWWNTHCRLAVGKC